MRRVATDPASPTKILILQSSGRREGNTARVMHMLEAALKAEAGRVGVALETETLDLARMDIRPCRGCYRCFDRGESECPLNDELRSVKEKMKTADGLVLAAPVYVSDMNGIMKNWIDRLGYVCHRPEFAGKTAMLCATTGFTPARRALRSMWYAVWAWGYRIAGQVSFVTGGTKESLGRSIDKGMSLMPAEELRERHSQRIQRAAQKLLQEIRDHRAERPSFFSLLLFRIGQIAVSQRAAPESVDFSFWNDKGWLDTRRCTYYFPHRTNPLKVGAARLLGSMAASFFR
jgi:multimeric flavodoxin WrbA